MATQQVLRNSINELIRQQLGKFQCVRGYLRYQPDVLAFSGTREDAKPVLIEEPHRQLGVLLSQYIQTEPDWAGLVIEIDLAGNIFDYKKLAA
jgi:hypothetical protein